MALPHLIWDRFMPLARSFGCAPLQRKSELQKEKKKTKTNTLAVLWQQNSVRPQLG